MICAQRRPSSRRAMRVSRDHRRYKWVALSNTTLGMLLATVALARLTRMLRREAPSALGQSALSALATISAEGPMRSGDVAAREGVRPPTMTRSVAVLEEGGYLNRTVDPADRRASLLTLTPLGADTLAGTRTARAGQLVSHLGQLTADQQRALAAALPALAALTEADSTVDSA